ncbi:MAG: SDR family oxidoreductase [Moraxellaceae bacterium]|nr:SDR family oxidoreductase [Moraxellaceae bacterium]MDZ4387546.1 SDR family oxidoreductase [Moraxellaceae bacterium]
MNKKNTSRTVFITGCDTGIGNATALYFQQHGWNVSATMLNPANETTLVTLPHVICPKLDVTDKASIDAAITETLQEFGHIDVVVNNAGYGLIGAFETLSDEQVRRQFDTNVFGLMDVCRAVLPYFRKQNSGTLINVSSMVGRIPLPLYSLYNASKFAVEGFSEGLIYELEPFNIRIKLIEPGSVKTAFFQGSSDRENSTGENAYIAFSQAQLAVMDEIGANGISKETAAETIFKSAIDNSSRVRYSVGMDAKVLMAARRLLPDSAFIRLIKIGLSPSLFASARRRLYQFQR